MSRTFPALDVTWAVGADEDRLDRLIAEIDEDAPMAVEEHSHRARIFFASPASRTRAAVRLIALESDLVCEPVDVPDESWAERSQASLGPVRVGRIVVAKLRHPHGHTPRCTQEKMTRPAGGIDDIES